MSNWHTNGNNKTTGQYFTDSKCFLGFVEQKTKNLRYSVVYLFIYGYLLYYINNYNLFL